jgi:hypothetical protein
VIRKRILWNDTCTHRVNIVAFISSCLFGELVLRRGIPVVVMITGSYIFMGLAEDFALYVEFVGLSILGCWLIFILVLSFELCVFSCGGLVVEAPAPRLLRSPHPPFSQARRGRSTLAASLSVGGSVVLGLGLLTMGCPLSLRDVPTPLSWLGSCLPFQSVFSAMMLNQVGSAFADGESTLKKSGFVPQGSLLVSAVITSSYLVIAIYIFLLQFPEPESGPSARLQGHVLDACLRSMEKGLDFVYQLGSKPVAGEDKTEQGANQAALQNRSAGRV